MRALPDTYGTLLISNITFINLTACIATLPPASPSETPILRIFGAPSDWHAPVSGPAPPGNPRNDSELEQFMAWASDRRRWERGLGMFFWVTCGTEY